MTQLIAVTGATGFIGEAICRRLVDCDYPVRVLVRSPGKVSPETFGDSNLIIGDLGNQDSLRELVRHADVVLHCAGKTRGATQVEFDRVNVDGTGNLLQAIKSEANAPRLLFLSSLAAREPGLSFYATSKHRAELLLHSEGAGVAWTIVRPPAVYGPGDREMLPLFKLMARGLVLSPGNPDSRFSLLHVDDLCSAILAWIAADPAPGSVFTIDDGHTDGYDWHEVGNIAGALCKRKVRVVRPSPWMLDFPAWINRKIGVTFGTSPMLTPEKLRELRHPDWVCDNSDFAQFVNWQPVIGLAEGLKATPGWPGYQQGESE